MSWGLLESREARRWLAAIAVLAAVGACDMDYGELFVGGVAGAGGDTGGSGGTGGTGGGSGGGGATGGGSGQCGPCAGEERCDAVYGCVECVQSSHCHSSAEPHCAFHECVECREDQHCTPSLCHSSLGVCGAACSGSNSCTSFGVADICADSYCVECRDTGDCGSGLLCNTSRGRCVECTGDGDCEAPTTHCSATGTCAECLLNEHCDAADECVAQQCAPR